MRRIWDAHTRVRFRPAQAGKDYPPALRADESRKGGGSLFAKNGPGILEVCFFRKRLRPLFGSKKKVGFLPRSKPSALGPSLSRDPRGCARHRQRNGAPFHIFGRLAPRSHFWAVRNGFGADFETHRPQATPPANLITYSRRRFGAFHPYYTALWEKSKWTFADRIPKKCFNSLSPGGRGLG